MPTEPTSQSIRPPKKVDEADRQHLATELNHIQAELERREKRAQDKREL